MPRKKKELTLEESLEVLEKYAADDVMLQFKNHRKHDEKPNVFRFTISVLSLDFIISLMEDEKIKNVYWTASVAPPNASAVDSITLRYRIFVEYHFV